MPKHSEDRSQIIDFRSKINHLGFTLIELLSVISLMAIVVGVGFASLVAYSQSQVLSQATADLKQAVATARLNTLSDVKPAGCTGTLSSYTVSFCTNSNPSCSTSGITNNKGYIVTAYCGNTTYPVSKTQFSSNVTFNTSVSNLCQDLKFSSVSNIASNSVNGGSCNLRIDAYGKNNQISIDSQGYVSP